MRKSFLIIAVICGILSCKTTLIIHDIKTENILNSENISTVDSSIINMLAPYKDHIKSEMQLVIGFSNTDLIKRRPESKLTNYLADLFLFEGRLYAGSHPLTPIPDVAYINYGGLRTDLPKGEITVGKIVELMPFENEMVLLQIKGTALYEFAERVAQLGGDGVSGIRLGIKEGKVSTLTIGEKPLDRSATYWVVTNDYIANGGDEMKMFLNREKYIQTGIKMRDCLIDHMRKDYLSGKTISPQLDGRIYHE